MAVALNLMSPVIELSKASTLADGHDDNRWSWLLVRHVMALKSICLVAWKPLFAHQPSLGAHHSTDSSTRKSSWAWKKKEKKLVNILSIAPVAVFPSALCASWKCQFCPCDAVSEMKRKLLAPLRLFLHQYWAGDTDPVCKPWREKKDSEKLVFLSLVSLLYSIKQKTNHLNVADSRWFGTASLPL